MIVVNNIYVQHNEFNTIGKEKEEKKQGVFVMEAWRKTMELDETVLKNLWNKFIEEIGTYENDAYIYDFKDKGDISSLISEMADKEYDYLLNIIGERRFFQVNDNKINLISPKEQVNKHWADIITRIINHPSFYQQIGENDYNFYGNIMLPIICDKLGVEKLK